LPKVIEISGRLSGPQKAKAPAANRLTRGIVVVVVLVVVDVDVDVLVGGTVEVVVVGAMVELVVVLDDVVVVPPFGGGHSFTLGSGWPVS
jgi:hypothetical protein